MYLVPMYGFDASHVFCTFVQIATRNTASFDASMLRWKLARRKK
jgi:hypothetical protein